MKKSNDYKITTSYDLTDIVTSIALIALCIIGICFMIFSMICAIGLLNSL